MYPERYRLPAIARHVLELLERRRPALSKWDEEAERRLRADAGETLAQVKQQFEQLAVDETHWKQMERSVLEVALPRYFRLAKEQSELEAQKYRLWRGGDLPSRAVYAALGVLLAAVVWRVAVMPKWLETLPLLLFIFGPLIPDFQVAVHRRRYRAQLVQLVEEMEEEAKQQGAYPALGTSDPDPSLAVESRHKEKA